MVVNCKQVWQEVSNYLEGEITPDLRAAMALISGSFALARLDVKSVSGLRSYHAEPGTGVPNEMMVTVSADGKTFHVPGCRFLHKHENENVRLIAASEAIREGYVPCVRC